MLPDLFVAAYRTAARSQEAFSQLTGLLDLWSSRGIFNLATSATVRARMLDVVRFHHLPHGPLTCTGKTDVCPPPCYRPHWRRPFCLTNHRFSHSCLTIPVVVSTWNPLPPHARPAPFRESLKSEGMSMHMHVAVTPFHGPRESPPFSVKRQQRRVISQGSAQ